MSRRYLCFALSLCLFLIIFGAKLIVIEKFGSDLPFWDQWDAEGSDLYLPYFQHHLGLLDLFKPQNEHRIFFTKALNLGLLLAGGQWDMRVQCVVNAALYGAFAVAVFLVSRRLLAVRWHLALFAACALLFGLPIAWFNVLNGFQSQFYFLMWFSLSAIGLLCFARVWSGAWWTGIVLSVLANFSMASGLLAAAAVAGVFFLRMLRRHAAWRDIWPTLAGCTAAMAVGMFTRVTVSWHEPLKAKSFHDFAFTIVHFAQWPNYGPPWFALIVYAPVVLITWQALHRRAKDVRAENLFLATSLWLLLQYAATGYARGVGGPWPVSRYLDTPAFGIVVNGMILAFLLDRTPLAGGGRIALRLLCLIWLSVVGQGLWHHTHTVFINELPSASENFHACERNVRAYLMTGDYAHLDGQVVPYPNGDTIRERLSHPELRALMPASVRPPLHLNYTAIPSGSFTGSGKLPKPPSSLEYARIWGSLAANGPTEGEWHSFPFTPVFDGYLKIDMAGYPGMPRVSLAVADAQTGACLAEVQPTRQPRESWRSAYVRAPRRPLVLTATDHNRQGWLAFSEPVEMSALSYRTMRLAKQGWLIFILSGIAGLSLWFLIRLGSFRSWREIRTRLPGSAE